MKPSISWRVKFVLGNNCKWNGMIHWAHRSLWIFLSRYKFNIFLNRHGDKLKTYFCWLAPSRLPPCKSRKPSVIALPPKIEKWKCPWVGTNRPRAKSEAVTFQGGPSAAMLQHGGGNICASSDEHSCGGSDDITVIDIRRDVFLVVSFLACDTCTTEIAIRRDQSVKETRVHQTAF